MTITKRKFLAVTLKPELHARVLELAAMQDISATAWVRQVVLAELERRNA